MTDDTTRRDDDELAPDAPVADAIDAAEAEAEEASAAAEEMLYAEAGDEFDEEAMQIQFEEAMGEAQHEGLLARASWSMVHKELLLLLFANCLFLVGVLSAWSRHQPWDEMVAVDGAKAALLLAEQNYNDAERKALDQAAKAGEDVRMDRAMELSRERAQHILARAQASVAAARLEKHDSYNGLSTIRGSLIFVLAIFGFFIFVLCIRYKQVIIWPFLLNALFALWIGIPGFTNSIGSARWDAAQEYMSTQSTSILAKFMAPLSTVPPGHWMLTAGGALVLIILLKGVLSGASAAKARQAETSERRRRR